jgi:hypothetical protein
MLVSSVLSIFFYVTTVVSERFKSRSGVVAWEAASGTDNIRDGTGALLVRFLMGSLLMRSLTSPIC